jgi:hypothetical protein
MVSDQVGLCGGVPCGTDLAIGTAARRIHAFLYTQKNGIHKQK